MNKIQRLKRLSNEIVLKIYVRDLQGHPSQSVHFVDKILGRKKVLRIIYTMDFLFPEKPISFEITNFSRFLHFRKNFCWFQLFIDIFSNKIFRPVEHSSVSLVKSKLTVFNMCKYFYPIQIYVMKICAFG